MRIENRRFLEVPKKRRDAGCRGGVPAADWWRCCADAARVEGYNVLFRGLVMFKQRGGKGESRNSFQRCTDNTGQDA